MKTRVKALARFLMISAGALVFVQCSQNADPAATSTVALSLSAVSTSQQSSMSGRLATASNGRSAKTNSVTLEQVTVNIRDIKFDYDSIDDHHHKHHAERDSSYDSDDDYKLKGPFLVDLMNAGSFIDNVITTAEIPAGTYEKIRFKLAPSEEAGNMEGKSIYISGKIDTVDFVFWHKRDAKFGIHLTDSTFSSNSSNVTLAINLELEKVLNALAGGVDLTKATDGNGDGVITIDPEDSDGNKKLADTIMMLLGRHGHCNRKHH